MGLNRCKVRNAKHLFAMGLPNRKAVAEKILSLNIKDVLILGVVGKVIFLEDS